MPLPVTALNRMHAGFNRKLHCSRFMGGWFFHSTALNVILDRLVYNINLTSLKGESIPKNEFIDTSFEKLHNF